MTLNLNYEPNIEYRPGYVYIINYVGTRKYRISLANQSRLKVRAQEIIRQYPELSINLIGWIEVIDCHSAKNCLQQHFSAYAMGEDWFNLGDHDFDSICQVYSEVLAKYWINENLSASEDKPVIAEEYDFFNSVNQYFDANPELESSNNSNSPYVPSYEASSPGGYSSGNDDSFVGWIIGAVVLGLIALVGSNMNKSPKIDFQMTSDGGQSRIPSIDLLPDDGRFTPNHRIDASVIGKSAAFIRSGPNQKSPAIGEPLINGTRVKTINRSADGEWFYVQIENKIKGWVYGSLIR